MGYVIKLRGRHVQIWIKKVFKGFGVKGCSSYLLVLGSRFQVIGYRLKVLGYRLQVIGDRLQVIGYRFIGSPLLLIVHIKFIYGHDWIPPTLSLLIRTQAGTMHIRGITNILRVLRTWSDSSNIKFTSTYLGGNYACKGVYEHT